VICFVLLFFLLLLFWFVFGRLNMLNWIS